ncbi:MAG: hypothetical protein ACK5WZ_05635 [Pseudobdellovibrionaceae bacterium]|jgi:hypothetical protein
MKKRNQGQVVLEYVLLLVISVSFAALVVRLFASRDIENPGFLVQKWDDIRKTIGSELPEKCSSAGGEVTCSRP